MRHAFGVAYSAPSERTGIPANAIAVAKNAKNDEVFVVLPKRLIIERTIGRLIRCRRLAKDWECLSCNGLAFLRWARLVTA